MLASEQGKAMNPPPEVQLRHFGGLTSGLEALAHDLQLPIPICGLLLLVSSSERFKGQQTWGKQFIDTCQGS